jgi:hypothetical protein
LCGWRSRRVEEEEEKDNAPFEAQGEETQRTLRFAEKKQCTAKLRFYGWASWGAAVLRLYTRRRER